MKCRHDGDGVNGKGSNPLERAPALDLCKSVHWSSVLGFLKTLTSLRQLDIKMAMVPKAQWAQRKDIIYLTIDLQDVRDPNIDISNNASSKHGKVSFKGEGKSHATGEEKHQYALDIDLFGVCSLKFAVHDEGIV